MRPTLWLTLIVCCVVACALRCVSVDATARPPAPPVAGDKPTSPSGQTVVFTASAEGFGTTDDLARKEALEDGQRTGRRFPRG